MNVYRDSGEEVGVIELQVKGIGCASCIAPIKIHLLKTRGVKGVHIIGYKVIVLHDKSIDPKKIIDESGIKDYYRIESYKHYIIARKSIYDIIGKSTRRPLGKYRI